jgi:hypothetical protein
LVLHALVREVNHIDPICISPHQNFSRGAHRDSVRLHSSLRTALAPCQPGTAESCFSFVLADWLGDRWYDDETEKRWYLNREPSEHFVKKHHTVVSSTGLEVWGAHPSPILSGQDHVVVQFVLQMRLPGRRASEQRLLHPGVSI